MWSDVAGSSAASLALVNNIDLSVSYSDGSASGSRVWLGNRQSYTDASGHTVPQWDVLNNVEQVVIDGSDSVFNSNPNPSATYFAVHVSGANIPKSSPQKYAIVVTGNVIAQPMAMCGSDSVVCPNGCSGHGQCSTTSARCNCDAEYTGADCSQNSTAIPRTAISLTDPTSLTFSTLSNARPLGSGAWAYYHFDLSGDGDTDRDLQVSLTRTSSVGDPDLYLLGPGKGYPSLTSYDGAASACDSCTGASGVSSFVLDAPLEAGRYHIAVHGFCCDSSTYSVKVTTDFAGAGKSDPLSAKTVIWVAVVVAAGLIVGALALVWYRHRQQRMQQMRSGGGGGGGGGGGQQQRVISNGVLFVSPPPQSYLGATPFSGGAIGTIATGPSTGYRLGGGGEVMVPIQPVAPSGSGSGSGSAIGRTALNNHWQTPLVPTGQAVSDALEVCCSGSARHIMPCRSLIFVWFDFGVVLITISFRGMNSPHMLFRHSKTRNSHFISPLITK